MTFLVIVLCAILIIPFVPWIFSKIADPINMAKIRRMCADEKVKVINIELFPNHYGVKCEIAGKSEYRKYKVTKGKLHLVKSKWKNTNTA